MFVWKNLIEIWSNFGRNFVSPFLDVVEGWFGYSKWSQWSILKVCMSLEYDWRTFWISKWFKGISLPKKDKKLNNAKRMDHSLDWFTCFSFNTSRLLKYVCARCYCINWFKGWIKNIILSYLPVTKFCECPFFTNPKLFLEC